MTAGWLGLCLSRAVQENDPRFRSLGETDGKAGPKDLSVADMQPHRAEPVVAGDEAAVEQRDEAIEAGDQTVIGMAGELQRTPAFAKLAANLG